MISDWSRRRVLAGVGGLSAAAITGVLIPDDGSSGEWPSYGYGFGNTGYNPNADGPIAASDDGRGLRADWIRAIDDGLPRPPVLVSGDVIAGGSLDALDAASGQDDWSVDLDTRLFATVALDGTAYVYTRDGRLAAFDADGGDERWTLEIQPQTAPVAYDGDLYVRGRRNAVQDGFEEKYGPDAVEAFPLYEVDTESGDHEVIQTYVTRDGDDNSVRFFSPLTATVDGALAFHTRSDLRAIDLDTGDELWTFEREPFEDMYTANTVAANGSVYTATNDDDETPILYAVDAETGEERWRFTRDRFGGSFDDPTVADGDVYVAHGTELLVLDAETGEQRWASVLPEVPAASGNKIHPKPVVADGVVYATTDRSLWAVDAADGTISQAYELSDSDDPAREFIAGPIVIGDRAYVPAKGDDSLSLCAFEGT